MDEDEVKSTNGFKLVFDWDKIADDINKIAMPMPSYYNGISYAYDLDSINIQADRNIRNEICSVSNNAAEFEEIKCRLEELEKANDIMRTDSKAMTEGLVIRENKIKELEVENSKLKEKIEELVDAIEYCKKNGIWAYRPIASHNT